MPPTSKLIRQILGAVSEFDKAMVAKLKGARERKGALTGKKVDAVNRTLNCTQKSWPRSVLSAPLTVMAMASSGADCGAQTDTTRQRSTRVAAQAHPAMFQLRTRRNPGRATPASGLRIRQLKTSTYRLERVLDHVY
jgi:hypothetical protein